MTIDLTRERDGVHILPAKRRTPAGEWGVVETLPLTLPETEAICHFAAFQRHDPPQQARGDQAIGGGANRVQGLRIEKWSEAIEGGLFAITQLPAGDWLVVLPIAGPEAMAWFAPTGDLTGDHDVELKVGTLGTEPIDAALPVLAWARRESVYRAAEDAWKHALAATGHSARLREQKPYPPLLEYLGWCSWEQHKLDIDQQIIIDSIRAIHDSGLPVRFVLVDDGHLRGDAGEKMMQNRLVGLGPNDKFPDGWRAINAERRENGVRWLALWQNFTGYWASIAPDNDLGDELNRHLMDVPRGSRLPRQTLHDAGAWYEAMVGYAQRAGFDFIKVDNQFAALRDYKGTANAVRATAHCNQALDRAAAARMHGLINCMAHNPVNLFNTPLGPVTRCSEDYKVNDAWRAKAHLHNSYQNMLWFGPTVWGDHDMFHSSDTFAGRMMAVSKAVSGGPCYLSDDPCEFNGDLIRPLCNREGKLLRPLAPAVPLPRSVLTDPFEHAEPYLAAAPLPGGAAAIVAYNLTEPEQPVRGCITPQDHADAAGLLDTARHDWPGPHEGLVLYDHYAGEAIELTDAWDFELPGFEDRLLLLCPIVHGWAVIGAADKYLSPAGVACRYADEDRLVLDVPEAGPLLVWRRGELRRIDAEAGQRIVDSRST